MTSSVITSFSDVTGGDCATFPHGGEDFDGPERQRVGIFSGTDEDGCVFEPTCLLLQRIATAVNQVRCVQRTTEYTLNMSAHLCVTLLACVEANLVFWTLLDD